MRKHRKRTIRRPSVLDPSGFFPRLSAWTSHIQMLGLCALVQVRDATHEDDALICALSVPTKQIGVWYDTVVISARTAFLPEMLAGTPGERAPHTRIRTNPFKYASRWLLCPCPSAPFSHTAAPACSIFLILLPRATGFKHTDFNYNWNHPNEKGHRWLAELIVRGMITLMCRLRLSHCARCRSSYPRPRFSPAGSLRRPKPPACVLVRTAAGIDDEGRTRPPPRPRPSAAAAHAAVCRGERRRGGASPKGNPRLARLIDRLNG